MLNSVWKRPLPMVAKTKHFHPGNPRLRRLRLQVGQPLRRHRSFRSNHVDIHGQVTVLEIPHLAGVEPTRSTEQDKRSQIDGRQGELPVFTPPTHKKPNHEWYQTSSTIIITVYVKNIPKDKCSVEITSQSVSRRALERFTLTCCSCH